MNNQEREARSFTIYLLVVGLVPQLCIRHGKVEASIAIGVTAFALFLLELCREKASNFFRKKRIHWHFGCASVVSFLLSWGSFSLNGASSLLSLGWLDALALSVAIYGYFVVLNDAAKSGLLNRLV